MKETENTKQVSIKPTTLEQFQRAVELLQQLGDEIEFNPMPNAGASGSAGSIALKADQEIIAQISKQLQGTEIVPDEPDDVKLETK